MNSLDEIGFNQEVPFEITMAESQYSNTDRIETEIQLADSGYGQGQILVNPLHLASIYTSFLNDGNIIQPYLQYSDNPAGRIWIRKHFRQKTVSQVMEGLTGVVNDPMAQAMRRTGMTSYLPKKQEQRSLRNHRRIHPVRKSDGLQFLLLIKMQKHHPYDQHGGECKRHRRQRLCCIKR